MIPQERDNSAWKAKNTGIHENGRFIEIITACTGCSMGLFNKLFTSLRSSQLLKTNRCLDRKKEQLDRIKCDSQQMHANRLHFNTNQVHCIGMVFIILQVVSCYCTRNSRCHYNTTNNARYKRTTTEFSHVLYLSY